ncbi:MAG: ATP-grasp domain-containing protein [Bacteroidales bacterium]|nr:ATP-grasp domain-containing protein [Bacteroidales bacterium]
MEKKKLIILGASIANKNFLLEVSKMEHVRLIILDGNPKSIGKEITPDFVCVDITKSADVLEIANKYKIDGIFSINEYGIKSAAYVSDFLGLKGISMATANAVIDKGTMREAWQAAGISQPDFRVILHKNEIYDFAEKVGYPLVIKPVDSGGGGRGVFVIHSPETVSQGFKTASQYLQRNNRMIIEKFINGIETSVEVVRFKERTHLIAFSDKVMAPYSSRVAIDISYPGKFSPEIVKKIGDISDKIMRALGIQEGIGHIEYIVTEDGSVIVLEMGARAGGGHTSHPIASHVSGMNYPQWIARFYLGEADTPQIEFYRGACYSFFYSEIPGILTGVTGVEVASNLSCVHSVESWIKPGEYVSILNSSMARVGCIVTLAKTREEALSVASDAKSKIYLHVTPDKRVRGELQNIQWEPGPQSKFSQLTKHQ